MIWKALEQNMNEQEIPAKMVETFEVGTDEASNDLREFLSYLKSVGLAE